MSHYPVQNSFPFIGVTKNKDSSFTLAPATLTATGSDNRKEIDIDEAQQVILHIKYTTGSAETNNSLGMLLEWSPDGTNYYQEATESVSSGVITEYQATRTFLGASAATAYSFRIAIPVADMKKIRVAFSETGVASNFGTLSVIAVVSGK